MMGRKKNTRLNTNGTTTVTAPTRIAHPAVPRNCDMMPAVAPAPVLVPAIGGGWYAPGGGGGGGG